MTVTEVNDAPTAVDDARSVAEDGSLVIDPRGNDSKIGREAWRERVKVSAVGSPAHGTAVVIASGTDAGKILYTPVGDYNGADSFGYTISDNGTTNGANDFKTDSA